MRRNQIHPGCRAEILIPIFLVSPCCDGVGQRPSRTIHKGKTHAHGCHAHAHAHAPPDLDNRGDIAGLQRRPVPWGPLPGL